MAASTLPGAGMELKRSHGSPKRLHSLSVGLWIYFQTIIIVPLLHNLIQRHCVLLIFPQVLDFITRALIPNLILLSEDWSQ